MSDIQEEQKRLYKKAEENDIKLLQEENKKLKDLCNKYEEEHNTTFIEWQKDIKANKKAIDYIEQILEFIISKNIKEEKREYERLEHIVNILKGDNK